MHYCPIAQGRGTLIPLSRAYQFAVSQFAAGTEFSITLARVRNQSEIGQDRSRYRSANGRGPSVTKSITAMARRKFRFVPSAGIGTDGSFSPVRASVRKVEPSSSRTTRNKAANARSSESDRDIGTSKSPPVSAFRPIFSVKEGGILTLPEFSCPDSLRLSSGMFNEALGRSQEMVLTPFHAIDSYRQLIFTFI